MKQLVGRRSAAVAGNGAAIEGEGRPTTGRFPLHLGLIAALVAGLLAGLPASPANGAPGSAGAARPDRSVPVTEVPSAATDEPRLPVDPPQPAVLPRRGSSVIDLPLAAGSGLRGTGSAVVGGLPVRVTPTLPPGADLAGSATARAATETAAAATPARVRVDVLDRAASAPLGAEVAVRLTRADGGTAGSRVRVELDYSAFRGAYGADWARRLGLVRLPGCPAPGAAAAGCPGDQRLAATNDAKAGVISAEVEVPAASVPGGAAGSTRGDPVGGEANAPQSTGSVLVGLVATASSPETGDFTKTDLTEASSWSAGLQSGDFKWSYPIDVPPVPGELTPEVALSYSSAAVDGQTAGRHTQPSEIGEGWSYSPGFIERTYRPCVDDSANSPYWTVLNTTPDMCWRLPNAQIMLNGKASEIVLGGDGTWRLEDGDGEKVQLVGEASQADAENEYWKITTTDGTQYWFGKQTLPNGRTGTNSVLTTEVFANHSSDPCFSTVSAKASRCPSQAVRWMLDYVVDPNGNEMSFWYGKTSNRTALVGDANSTGLYYREIHLNRIEYGTHTSDASTVPAPARVVFTYANRCLTSSCGTHDATNWPDTPWDLECLDTSCGNNKSPSYWTHLRLSQISTQVLAAGAYTVVDQWDLAHQFPATGDGSSPVLWLASITRTGKTAGGSISLPPVTFSGLRSQNRADYDPTAGMASHNKWRINKVVTESGHQIAVTYAATDTGCQFGSAFPDPDNNGKRCFPQIYKPTSGAAGWSWWHKRIVSDVVESDLTGASPNSIEHEYVYSLAATNAKVLWGHDNGARVWGASLSGRSWSDWRGYTNVIVRTGTPGIIRSQNEYVYFRGLEGDRTVAGTRDANITLYSGTWGDQLQRRGELANEIEYDVSGGVAQTVVQHNPWTVVTGTRTLSSAWATPGTFKSYINRIASTSRWERLDDGTMSYRTGVEDTFDAATGRLTSRYEKGNSAAGDETCTRYSYADNAAKHMYDFKIREQMVQGTCADPYTIPDDLVSDHAWRYDNGAYGAAPTLGNVTRDYVYKDTGWVDLQTNVGYDKYGRVISSDDGLLRRTLTTYTENSDRLTTTVQVTNPLGHVTKSSLDVARGLPLTVTDANLKTTTASYDALGRLATVTRPGNTTGLPDVDYAYAVSRSSPSYVRTRTLGPNGNQIASYDILDGMLRPRQTQTVAPDGKRVITDTQYNDRGLAEKTTTFYNADSGPSSALIAFNDADVDQQTRTVYDPQERVTDEELWSRDVFQWETKTSYGFNSTSVMPPTGGTVTKDVVDDRGNLVEKWQYRERSLSAAADVTRYGYNLRDEPTSVTDPAGNTWTYEYNLLGWRTRTIDPDAGTSTATYDNAGQLTGTTDARGATLAYKYDALGRKVSTHQGSDTGTKLAEWTYDTIAKGQPATSTRHDGGLAYTSAVLSYDDAYRPTGSRLTVPASTANGALAGQYTTATSYKVSGAVATQTLPGVGGLPNETVSYSYTNQGLLSTMTGTWPGGGAQTYVAGTQYQFDGLVADQLLGATGKQVRLSNTFDAATRRLSKQQIDLADQVTSGAWVDKYTTEYGYDAAGNIRAAAGETDGVRDQVECFTYDYLRRLTEAWTNATWNCSAGPQRTGADAYWRQWTFDVVGDRRTQVDKDSAAGTPPGPTPSERPAG